MSRLFICLAVAPLTAAPATGGLVITDAIPGTFIDISTSGTGLGFDDDGVAEIDPGFDLTGTLFAGSDASGSIWVSNNGAVGFLGDGSAGAWYQNEELPSSVLFGGAHDPPQALAVYWDDLDSDTGDVYYQTIGEPGARVLIVQWHNRPHFPGDSVLDGDEATFQLQIFESGMPGHAQFLYLDVDFQDPELDNGASATIGYQAGGIGNDVQWSFNTPGAVHAGDVLTLVEAGCVGDLDDDGDTDQSDLGILLASWQLDDGGDLDGDGDTDQSDLGILLADWGCGT